MNGLFEVTIELKDGTNERIGDFQGVENALDQFVKAMLRLNNEIIDRRVVPIFEAIKHPQYKMMRIR